MAASSVDVAARFSDTLKTASSDVHDRAERSPFIRRLLAGEEPLDRFAELVAQHHAVYTALEAAATALADDPVARRFAVPELARVPALEADLLALRGDGWRDELSMNDGTRRLVDRIGEVCSSWPGGFVAHHYVRYLGDLSGGQIVRRILARTYGITDGRGLSFYVFDQIDNGVQFKKRYRELLDTAPWDDTERARIVDEVVLAFELNAELLESFG